MLLVGLSYYLAYEEARGYYRQTIESSLINILSNNFLANIYSTNYGPRINASPSTAHRFRFSSFTFLRL